MPTYHDQRRRLKSFKRKTSCLLVDDVMSLFCHEPYVKDFRRSKDIKNLQILQLIEAFLKLLRYKEQKMPHTVLGLLKMTDLKFNMLYYSDCFRILTGYPCYQKYRFATF